MVDPNNPLTARVIVNRIWQHHFGDGIVRSPDDFGVMGQLPSHQWPDGPEGVATLPSIAPEDLQVTPSPFGDVEHPRPLVAFSDTPSYWATPPRPAGSGRLAWD